MAELKPIWDQAWELYCAETAGGMDVRDHWRELPERVRWHYIREVYGRDKRIDYRKISDLAMRRCIFGVVDSLNDLFEDRCYSLEHMTENRRQVVTERPEGFYFMGSDEPRINTWLSKGKYPFAGSLGVKPNAKVVELVRNECTHGRLQSFRIIPWKDADVALVFANDCMFIASPWVALLPLGNVTEINQENTRIA